ncbi:hypothetical protein [Desulforhabdus sp. TSK]|uniref:hypothetical protein n=1 Tax=Desulforhabdus sp. TSK TaxID=2925014 RepID=UPI001FC86403|nr:hypothetical protein [Desulforhabdus sp. TSK]
MDKTPYDQLNSKVVHRFSLGYLGIWIIGLFGITTSDIVGAVCCGVSNMRPRMMA